MAMRIGTDGERFTAHYMSHSAVILTKSRRGDGADRKGRNQLGVILMELRQELGHK